MQSGACQYGNIIPLTHSQPGSPRSWCERGLRGRWNGASPELYFLFSAATPHQRTRTPDRPTKKRRRPMQGRQAPGTKPARTLPNGNHYDAGRPLLGTCLSGGAGESGRATVVRACASARGQRPCQLHLYSLPARNFTALKAPKKSRRGTFLFLSVH